VGRGEDGRPGHADDHLEPFFRREVREPDAEQAHQEQGGRPPAAVLA
jgi:hypothetical protein